MLKNRNKIHKFTLTMFRNIPGTTATYENCPTILARNYKNDDKLSTGASVHSINENESSYLRLETH